MDLSVIICTFNPRMDYLRRVLDALKHQTLSNRRWELLVVDNRSTKPLAGTLDLAWHPAARVVREERPGIVQARLRGFEESVAPVIVYVDDDNVLPPDYLASAERLAATMPFMGVWSAAVIKGEFETPPQPWMTPYLPYLALRDMTTDRWSNHPEGQTLPTGAGMVARRSVLAAYHRLVNTDRRRHCISRDGTSLVCGEDTDIGLVACGIGLGCGYMTALRHTHLIPSRRLETAYLIRLVEDITASHYWLELSRGVPIFGLKSRIKLTIKGILGRVAGKSRLLCFEAARARGYIKGAALFERTSTTH